MVTARYSVSQDNEGLLSFLYPDRLILRNEEIGGFIPSGVPLIVYTERKNEPYPDRDCIIISHFNSTKLDTVDGLLEVLGTRVKLRTDFVAYLRALDWLEFLELFKLVWVSRAIPDWFVEKAGGTVFDLFKVMFESFYQSYPVYRKLGKSHSALCSALLTMMIRCMEDKQVGVSISYWKALQANKTYLGYFKTCILDYVDSQMQETDFISLLYRLSQAKTLGR
ncbi:MAG: hypothetical protein M0P69_07535 [Bacteroidales bacterium]|nr:hypothetical protein [Bacteroidales bacterium]